MAGQDAIKQKIQLDGEKEYSAAIKAAQRNLRTLRSELKAETAELGKNATEQQKNEAKTKSLKKQIAEQEKIVKAYKAALAEVKEKYGDNEEAIAKWEVKLNDARTALANMKNGLNDAGAGFKNIEAGAASSVLETKALADTFGDIAGKADAMATGIEDIFRGVADAVAGMVGDIWGDLMEVASRADQYFDLGAFLGASATDVQKWDYAMKSVSGDISTITNMVSRLKYGGKADKVTEYFGISGENYTNDLEYAEAVLQQMYAMKDEMKAAGTWDDAMEAIFGARKTQEIDGILSDWEQIQNSLKIFGKEGMTEDQLQTMADLRYQVDLLTQRWDLFKSKVETQLFGKLALDLTGNAQGILDAFIELIGIDPDDPNAAKKRDDAIKKLEDNLTEAFTAIGEAIEGAAKALSDVGETLSGSDNQYVKMVGQILTGIADAMEWMTKPGAIDTIKGFLETFFGLWVSAKAFDAIGNIVALGTNISTLLGLGAAGGLSAGASFAQAGATAGTSWGAAFGKSLLKAAPVVAFLYTMFENAFKHQGNDDILTDEEMTALAKGEATPEIKEKITEANKNYNKNGFDVFTGEPLKVTVEPEPADDELLEDPLLSLMGDQRTAAEQYWDTLRSGANPEELLFAEQDLLDHFVNAKDGMEKFSQLMSLIDTLNTETPDLPSWWFGGEEGNTLTKDDINTFSGLPAQMQKAVQAGVSGIKVNMDGRAVGNLVAPYVSEQIARVAVSE